MCLDRSCLEQNEARLAFLVRILRLLHLMLGQLGQVIEEGKRPLVLRRLVLTRLAPVPTVRGNSTRCVLS